ncbi:hypothetical protein E3N88_10313 [Mikania micrantha]|uniref:Mannose-P-dolichol utilization defect 1 protein homolog n=1 Tax=Mikania micrantha TaxID=192012 RepID=A0A5N6PBZ6_9ASTR|nr:hypothetical protein E3N88_10313 [Mikania micrantha]
MVRMEFLGMDFSCVFGSLNDGKFPPKDCLLPLISKLLGYAIVAASTTVKLPQIMKIIQHKSVRGLSVVAFEMEVIGYTIALAYCLHKGLPFSAYGELAFLLIQAIILVATIYYFSQPVGNSTWIRALFRHGFGCRDIDKWCNLKPNYHIREANNERKERRLEDLQSDHL